MHSSKKRSLSGPSHSRKPSGVRRRAWIFVALFSTFCITGFAVLLSPVSSPAVLEFSHSLVSFCGVLIGACGGHARVEGAILRDPSSGFSIEMKDGCNAANVTVFLWSAMLAFPSSWKTKVWGFLAGGIVIHAINIVRFISLFYLGLYSRYWFDFAHAYLWETLLVLDTVVVFSLWVNRVSQSAAVAHAA
jgi:exosortase H (IPTLxxWG-CTERM-specific)